MWICGSISNNNLVDTRYSDVKISQFQISVWSYSTFKLRNKILNIEFEFEYRISIFYKQLPFKVGVLLVSQIYQLLVDYCRTNEIPSPEANIFTALETYKPVGY